MPASGSQGWRLDRGELRAAFDGNGLSPDDVVMGVLPLFHIFGCSLSMNAGLTIGAVKG